MLRSIAPYALAVLRIVAGFLFVCHGAMKAIGWLSANGPMPAGSLLWTAGWIETVGGLLVIVGLFTGPVAFILCGEMAAAYFKGHASKGFFPALNGGEPAVLFCFIFLYLCAAGPGAWSLDRLRSRRVAGSLV